MGYLRILAGIALLFCASASSGVGARLPAREPVRGYGFTGAFPGLTFPSPVGLVSPPGETNRLFVVSQTGTISVIADLRNPAPATFLDLRRDLLVSTEAGLLGLAFHPRFAENGRFFVYRTLNLGAGAMQLSEFACDPASNQADPGTEKVLISQPDMLDTHNAGDLKFGPDGYLYLALGDEMPGPPDDHSEPQAIDKGFFAGIIRIDVDNLPGNPLPNAHHAVRGQYRIPRGNPFVGASEFNGRAVDPAAVRTEFYAVGLRNPWRFAFDPLTGQIVCADVGSGRFEEIDLIERGGNYGWPFLEAFAPNLAQPLPAGLKAPVYAFAHGTGEFEGTAVIGGLVCRGPNYPELAGQYLFADYESGKVWAIDPYAPNPAPRWIASRAGIAAFGIHPADGSILIASHIDGRIERLVRAGLDEPRIPERLSELGAFADLRTLQPAGAAIPFEVAAPLWSDGAAKYRWMDLGGASGGIRVDAGNRWTYPEGGVWIKHFELTNGVPAAVRRIETRFLVKTKDDVYGLTYRWNDEQTDAVLVPPEGAQAGYLVRNSGVLRTQVWSFPSAEQCRICHNAQSSYVLGFTAHQLNRAVAGTNQLAQLAARGVFENPERIVPSEMFKLAGLEEPGAPLQHKVRSYLEANCVHCHQPGGRSRALWDAQADTPLAAAGLVGAAAAFQAPPMKIIDPHNPGNSYIYNRTAIRGFPFQMPPMATALVDDRFVEVLARWIRTMPDAGWFSTNYGPAPAEGSAEEDGESLRLYSAGTGFGNGSYLLLGKEVSGGIELSARITRLEAGEAGLSVRSDRDSGATIAALYFKGPSIMFRTQIGTVEGSVLAMPNPGFDWLSLRADDRGVTGWGSGDGTNWTRLGAVEVSLPARLIAGFIAARAGEESDFAGAEFTKRRLSAIEMLPPGRTNYLLPAEIPLEARLPEGARPGTAVTFYAGGNALGTVTGAPWRMIWTNAIEGAAEIRAVLNGAVTSPPIFLRLEADAPQVTLMPLDLRTAGSWNRRYGAEAYLIPGTPRQPSPNLAFDTGNAAELVLGSSTDPAALRYGPERIASVARARGDLEIRVTAQDYQVRRGALYFADWANLGREQEVSFWGADSAAPLAAARVNAATPAYLPFVFRAPITIRIHNPAGDAWFAGLFFGRLTSVTASLLAPENGAVYYQPAWVPVEVDATAPGREVSRVEIWDGETTIASFTTPPFVLGLTNLYPGEHRLRALVRGSYGSTVLSEAATVTILPPAPVARFIGADTNTMGTWRGRYGADGYWLIGGPNTLPPWLRAVPADHGQYLFTDDSRLPQALQWPEGPLRFASSWFGRPNFTMEVQPLEGWPARVGLYFLDFNASSRATEIAVEDLAGNVLDRRALTDYALGKYLFWEVQGQVRFRFTARTQNAVLSALFLDQKLTAADLLRNNFYPPDLHQSDPAFLLADSDGDGFANGLEYFLGYNPAEREDAPELRATIENGRLALSFSHRALSPDLRLGFARSGDLVHWQAEVPDGIALRAEAGANWVTFRFPANGSGPSFIRTEPFQAEVGGE